MGFFVLARFVRSYGLFLWVLWILFGRFGFIVIVIVRLILDLLDFVHLILSIAYIGIKILLFIF